jgi:NADH-quinone oxidoreductase subunit G
MSELVTLTIDDREVQVPKGTGLVETAAAAGIEIPVFCYEPRLGPPVGACRMCLVEVEGLPKLQAGCTLTAQDGMVVRTSATSTKAADGQNATLEFILVNHPLDCPVCDKGGECPLQDLTFRYGPGSTRMTFSKMTFEKPIPVSPLIALDRERCILCYRCTRFSSDVAEDEQLIARNRGAYTEIATFADDPYRAPFSGNVVELCPVGALTSTQYRFRARPWEIQSVPTVCGLCPVGCNVTVNAREGKVERVLSRNHPEIDGGWLCDKGRFAHPHLRAPDRILEPLSRRSGGLERVSWDAALDEAERLLRDATGHVVTALSGTETIEQAYALGRLLRGGLGAHSAVLPESTSDALDAFRAPLSTIGEAELVVVVGDDPVVDRAPIVDLWIRRARRNGAQVITIGALGEIRTEPGSAGDVLHALADPGFDLGDRVENVGAAARGYLESPSASGADAAAALADRLRASDRSVLVWSGPGGGGGARVAETAHALGFEGKPGCAAYHLPASPNGAGVALAWAASADEDESDPEHIRLLVVSGDAAAASPGVRDLAERADHVIAIAMFHELAVGWADLVLPATAMLERDGTLLNVEGRLQRLRRAVVPPVPDELAWVAGLAARFDVEVSPYAAVVFEEIADRMFGGVPAAAIDGRAPLPARAPYAPPPMVAGGHEPHAAPAPAGEEHLLGTLRLLRARPLFSGPEVERVAELQFQRPDREAALAPADAERRGIVTGDTVELRSNGTSVELRARVDRRLASGAVRVADEHAEDLHQAVEVVKR